MRTMKRMLYIALVAAMMPVAWTTSALAETDYGKIREDRLRLFRRLMWL